MNGHTCWVSGGRRLRRGLVRVVVIAKPVLHVEVVVLVADGTGLPRVVVVLPVNHLGLRQAQVGPLLLVLGVRLLALQKNTMSFLLEPLTTFAKTQLSSTYEIS